jgi:uracil-DNA glycosylase
MHPAVLLWSEHEPAAGYPTGVLRIREPIPGTAFFPGGYGIWNPTGSRELPPFPVGGVMILGQDFHSEAGYLASLACGAESSNQPTWRNLIALLSEVGLAPSDCFFTNAFMGLRVGDATTGPFPGASDPEFVAHCRWFLARQLQVQQPSLVVTLGIYAPGILAPLSPELGSWAGARGLKHLDATGPLCEGVTFPDVPGLRTVAVALTHPSLRAFNVRHRRYRGRTGNEAELLMLRDARAASRRELTNE